MLNFVFSNTLGEAKNLNQNFQKPIKNQIKNSELTIGAACDS